ncbi:LacI family DNA-binding transcriptional regulator [Salinispira pacifica]|uniref:Putative transcriptional regulator (LacI family) n=1 Tax=Salinispira pacifica TaxID=1307761 RepID=V5WIW0_9SPIO|nr:LacI family DNA-binding transcriptional regulator [Salinispira pacifica]AHC15545.1 putative transcriptional regulator (lacI family) [Salinispira pacifica]
MKITIQDIAREAGVSKGTVSKVLNNRAGIGKETRERILSIIKQRGYTPDYSAQALAYSRTRSIGVLIPHRADNSVNGAYWAHMLAVISREAAARDYWIQLLTEAHEGMLGELVDRVISNRKVDGLIISAELLDEQAMERLEGAEIPYVMLGRREGYERWFVDIRNYEAAARMTEHILSAGCRSPAIICGPDSYPHYRSRKAGFLDRLEKSGINGHAVSVSELDELSAAESIRLMLHKNPGIDSLFIAGGGNLLFSSLRALEDEPEPHRRLCVFDDFPYNEFIRGGLTALRQPVDAMGGELIRILLKRLENPLCEPEMSLFPAELVVRGSL